MAAPYNPDPAILICTEHAKTSSSLAPWSTGRHSKPSDWPMSPHCTNGAPVALSRPWCSPPANAGTADSGTTLVTFAGNASQFGTVSSGVLTVSAIANATAAATGTAGYFRIYPSSATTTNAVIQGLCAASGSDMNLTNTSITSGQTCSFTSMTITAFGA